ncbi:protein DEK isoform 1-T3 [Anableps anableps]
MSDVAEEAMDSSALSEEDDLQRDESAPRRSSSKIPDVGEILEGKRAKKTVERLDFQAPKAKEKLKVADGGGDKLGDIPRANYEINRRKAEELKLLHSILFDRPGKSASIKKNLRLFNGFPFDADSQEFTKKREKMLRNSNLTNTKLKLICTVLDLEKKGTHLDLIDRILNFLIAPKNSGKRAPVKKKRRSKKKLSGDSIARSKKSKPKAKSSSSSSKKSKPGSKSKAIVMDSSSDEEEDEEKMEASVEAKEKTSEPEEEEEEQSDKSEESEEEQEESDESSKPKSSRGKKKRQRTPAKKTGPPKKRAKNQSSDESDRTSEAEEKPKKKKVAAAKTKKADSSSSNKNNTNAAEDSSDDDEPLIRMIKRAPTDEQLRKTVENLLKEANLEEMTMKQICQKVFDTYPEHDLSSRKDFIKQTVKTLIT